MFLIQLLFPIFRPIVGILTLSKQKRAVDLPLRQPTARSRTLDRAFDEIQHVGNRLIEERKAAILAERSDNGSCVVEKQDVQGHDLLSLLIKSNMAIDIPESMRMSDSEILSRECSFPCSN
jgi:cytochrome P450